MLAALIIIPFVGWAYAASHMVTTEHELHQETLKLRYANKLNSIKSKDNSSNKGCLKEGVWCTSE